MPDLHYNNNLCSMLSKFKFSLKVLYFLGFLILLTLIEGCGKSSAEQKHLQHEAMKADFKSPPEDVKPWLYWYWINNHISREGITKDLETMADLGIGAALIG